MFWGQKISGIETSDSQVTGIMPTDRTVAADIVIVAAGAETNRLTLAVGIDVDLEISLVTLLRS
jgi:glycine/D-amino acid oxidase-like deaminating enzyme